MENDCFPRTLKFEMWGFWINIFLSNKVVIKQLADPSKHLKFQAEFEMHGCIYKIIEKHVNLSFKVPKPLCFYNNPLDCLKEHKIKDNEATNMYCPCYTMDQCPLVPRNVNNLIRGISLVGVPKKVVPLSKSAHVSVSSEFFLQIKLILSSPNVVLTFYTYKVSNKKVSS
jgi:hypothetical protein